MRLDPEESWTAEGIAMSIVVDSMISIFERADSHDTMYEVRQPWQKLPNRRSPYITVTLRRQGEMDKVVYAPKNWEIAA